MSRNLAIVVVLAFCAFGAWEHFGGQLPSVRSGSEAADIQDGMQGVQMASAARSIVVYGQDTCSYTQHMRDSLSAANVSFTYVNIDEPANRDILYNKFHGTGLARGGLYLLPVVEVGGRASMRPSPDSVIRVYQGQ
jgi:glutaredoxin